MVSSLWRLLAAALTGFLFFHGSCSPIKTPHFPFLHQATAAPKISYYDYIIVGGGTSGCPLAATLSQKFNVLVLERGDSPYGNPDITNITNAGAFLFDFSPESPAQLFISNDGVVNQRARVLGGGTAINVGFYSRAEPAVVRDYGWDEKLVNESYKWVEDVMVHEPRVSEWQSAVRDGLLEAGVVPYNGFTYDHLIGTKVGGTIFDTNGYRHTAADLFSYANPYTTSIFLHATVHRILFQIKGKSRPKAHGVIFRDALGIKHKAYLKGKSRGEIILSAGAIGSPQLLLLSGVGPKAQLQAHNITVVLDQPFVGQGMADNPLNLVFVPSPIPVEFSLVEIVGITNTGNYIEALSGINLGGVSSSDHGQFSAMMGGLIGEKVSGPASKGHLELQNRDVNDNPYVTFNYFKEPIDLQRCIAGVKTIFRLIESKAFSKFKLEHLSEQDILNITTTFLPQNFPVNENTTTSLEQFCKDTVRTLWHYHGGCQVGTVIDHDYRVLGIDALRVIDGSTFNNSPGTNPQATLLMLGRYMGIKMLTEGYSLKQVKIDRADQPTDEIMS